MFRARKRNLKDQLVSAGVNFDSFVSREFLRILMLSGYGDEQDVTIAIQEEASLYGYGIVHAVRANVAYVFDCNENLFARIKHKATESWWGSSFDEPMNWSISVADKIPGGWRHYSIYSNSDILGKLVERV